MNRTEVESTREEKIQKIIELADQGKVVGIIAGAKNGEWDQYTLKKKGDLYELLFTPAFRELDIKDAQLRKVGDLNNSDIQIELYKIDKERDIARLIVNQ